MFCCRPNKQVGAMSGQNALSLLEVADHSDFIDMTGSDRIRGLETVHESIDEMVEDDIMCEGNGEECEVVLSNLVKFTSENKSLNGSAASTASTTSESAENESFNTTAMNDEDDISFTSATDRSLPNTFWQSNLSSYIDGWLAADKEALSLQVE